MTQESCLYKKRCWYGSAQRITRPLYRKHTIAGMLSITIVTLLITSNVISNIQAEEQGKRKAQFNEMQIPVYRSDSVIEALKVQKRDTLNIVPKSYVEQTNHVDESQRGNRLQRDLPDSNFMKNLDNIFSAHYTTFNRTGVKNYGSLTYQSNNVYNSVGENDVYGSVSVLIGNTFFDNPNGTNVYGPILVQENNTYLGENKKFQYEASVMQNDNNYPEHRGKHNIYKNPRNKTSFAIIINQSNNTYLKSIENNKDALKLVINQIRSIYSSSNDSEAGMNAKNNTKSQVHSLGQNATDSQEKSLPTNYDLSSNIENRILYNKEKEAYTNKLNVFNRQMSLSSNVFYSLLYSMIILLKYS